MNNPSLSRKLAGIGLIIFGVVAALGSLNIIDFGSVWHQWWPVGLIAVGLLIWIADSKQWLWMVILGVFGLLVLLRNVWNGIDFNPLALFWPAVIVIFGVSLLKNRRPNTPNTSQNSLEDSFALLGGVESRSLSHDYRGGKATSILGGVDIDLRDAKIKDDAVIDVTVLMGGVDIKVSRDVIVKNNITAIMGGVENKALVSDNMPKNAPTLTLVGTVVLGGVEIKY